MHRWVAFGLLLLSGTACTNAAPAPGPHVGVRFAIEVDSARSGPVYVLIEATDGQPGWVSVTGPTGRVHLRTRCDIAECGGGSGVCGASIPVIRNIGSGAVERRIETIWDGMVSTVDSATQCQRRVPAPAGDYVARFCYSGEAEYMAGADTTRAAPGRLVHPTCLERRFNLADQNVVLRVGP